MSGNPMRDLLDQRIARKARSEFARRLREQRERSVHTPASLARAVGMDPVRYARYEHGTVNPSLGVLVRICRELRITPNDLLGFSPFGEVCPHCGAGNAVDCRLPRCLWN